MLPCRQPDLPLLVETAMLAPPETPLVETAMLAPLETTLMLVVVDRVALNLALGQAPLQSGKVQMSLSLPPPAF